MEKNTASTPIEDLSLSPELPTPQKVGTVGTVAEIASPAAGLPVPTPPPMPEHPSEQSAAATTPISPLVEARGPGRVAGFDAAAAGRPELEANAARSNLTHAGGRRGFVAGDRVYVAHQLLPFGRLHQAVVEKVVNASIHFTPPIEGLQNDPEDPDAGEWPPPAPLQMASSNSCLPERGTEAGVTIKQIERDGQELRLLSYRKPHADGSESIETLEIPVPEAGWQPLDEDGLDAFLAEVKAQNTAIARGLQQSYGFRELA